MPRFFFHLFDDLVTLDEEGAELPDAKAAYNRAIREARVQMCETVKQGHIVLRHRIEVVDDQGNRVATVSFVEAVEVES